MPPLVIFTAFDTHRAEEHVEHVRKVRESESSKEPATPVPSPSDASQEEGIPDVNEVQSDDYSVVETELQEVSVDSADRKFYLRRDITLCCMRYNLYASMKVFRRHWRVPPIGSSACAQSMVLTRKMMWKRGSFWSSGRKRCWVPITNIKAHIIPC